MRFTFVYYCFQSIWTWNKNVLKWNEKLGLIIAESGNVWKKWIRRGNERAAPRMFSKHSSYIIEKHGNLASSGPIDMSVDLTDSSDNHFCYLISCTEKCCGINLLWIRLLDYSSGHPCTQLMSLSTASITPQNLIKRIASYVFGFRPGIDIHLLIFRSHINNETHLNLHPIFFRKR